MMRGETMNAMIQILAGPGAGNVRPVDRNVFRLGNLPGCELMIEGNDLLTVQRRGGCHYLHNRGTQDVMLGEKRLACGQSAPWLRDQKLVLSQGSVMTLRIPSAATPSSRRENGDTDTVPDGPPAAAAENAARPAAANRKRSISLVVAAIAALILFARVLNNAPAASHGNTDVREEIIREMIAADFDESTNIAAIRAELQEAILLQLRGSQERAHQKFLQVRNSAASLPPDEISDELKAKLLAYVNTRL
jgi:hypothetical protein